jgi:CHASE2 domain-containing sensor protein
MTEDEEGGRATLRVFAVAALALAGLAFSATPLSERLDAALLDLQWTLLRKFDPRPAADDIIVVGVDAATTRPADGLPGMWHQPVGEALERVAAAGPRAIGLALALPERSYDGVRAGLDRTLLAGLLAARANGPVVGVISIDARTRAAKPIHPPFLAALGDAQLGLDMLSRDVDGVTRHFSLLVPTEDGGFPTFAGRLCRALSKRCGEGLIHFGLGEPFRYVPVQRVLESRDPRTLAALFRNRIVLIGEIEAHADRIAVPINLAGWEHGGDTSPAVVVHAQALRTALADAAPVAASRPVILILVMLAAAVVLVRDGRHALLVGLLGAAGLLAAATFVLRAGIGIPVAAGLFTLATAAAARLAFAGRRAHRRRSALRRAFAGRVGKSVLRDILRGALAVDGPVQRGEAAFVAAGLCDSAVGQTGDPGKAMAVVARFERAAAAAVHRHGGMVEHLGGGELLAVFGAPKPLGSPCRAAWDCIQDLRQTFERLDRELPREGGAPLAICIGASLGAALFGRATAHSTFRYGVVAEAAREAQRLREESRHRRGEPLISEAFRECLGEGAGPG